MAAGDGTEGASGGCLTWVRKAERKEDFFGTTVEPGNGNQSRAPQVREASRQALTWRSAISRSGRTMETKLDEEVSVFEPPEVRNVVTFLAGLARVSSIMKYSETRVSPTPCSELVRIASA